MCFLKKSMLVCLILALSLIMFGCDDDDSTSSSDDGDTTVTYNYVGTQTAGDFWEMEVVHDDSGLETGELDLTNTTTEYYYSGVFESSDEPGFVLADITDSDDPDFSESFESYMVSVPGTMNIIAPGPFEVFDHGDGTTEYPVYGTSTPPITTIYQGECPSEGGTYNMIMMPAEDWGSTEDPAYGTVAFTLNEDNSTWDIEMDIYLLDGTAISDDPLTISGATCEDGVISGELTVEEDTMDVKFSFTESGLFFMDLPEGEGAFVGVQSDEEIDAEDFFEPGREFTGMYFNSNYGYYDGTSHPETDPTYAYVEDSDTIMGNQYIASLEEEDNRSDDSFEMSFGEMDQPVPGLISTTFTDADGTHDYVMAIRQIEDRYFMFSVSDNWPSYHGYNTLLIEQLEE